MACNSQADKHDASAVMPFSDDALWICPEALLKFFDSETRGTWRLLSYPTMLTLAALLSPFLGKHPEEETALQMDCEPDMAILSRCPALQRVKLLGAPKGLALTGLPLSLRGIEISIRSDSISSDDPGDSDHSGSADSGADDSDADSAAADDDSDAAGGHADSDVAGGHADSEAADDSDVVPEVGELTDRHLSPALHRLAELSQLQEAALHGFPYTRLPTLEFHPALRSIDLSTWAWLLLDLTA
eukprot:gene28958-biopygen32834